MCDLLYEFVRIKNDSIIRLSEEFDFDFTEDFSKFTIVDGEEGDYGEVSYYHNNNLVGKKIFHDGDDYDYEYTDYGKELMIAKFRELVGEALEIDNV